jgi:hypothetical protein
LVFERSTGLLDRKDLFLEVHPKEWKPWRHYPETKEKRSSLKKNGRKEEDGFASFNSPKTKPSNNNNNNNKDFQSLN